MVIYPHYISLKNWAASLAVDYPDAQLPVLKDEKKWQEWAAVVANTGAFYRGNVPFPFLIKDGARKDNFQDWQQWAKAVYVCMLDIEVLGEDQKK